MTAVNKFSQATIKTMDFFEEEGSYLLLVEAPETGEEFEGAGIPIKYDPALSPRVDILGGTYQIRVPTNVFQDAVQGMNVSEEFEELKGLNVIFTTAKEQDPLDKGSSVLTVGSFEVLRPPEAIN